MSTRHSKCSHKFPPICCWNKTLSFHGQCIFLFFVPPRVCEVQTWCGRTAAKWPQKELTRFYGNNSDSTSSWLFLAKTKKNILWAIVFPRGILFEEKWEIISWKTTGCGVFYIILEEMTVCLCLCHCAVSVHVRTLLLNVSSKGVILESCVTKLHCSSPTLWSYYIGDTQTKTMHAVNKLGLEHQYGWASGMYV